MRRVVTTALVLAASAVIAAAQTEPVRDAGAVRARVPTTLKYLNERIDEVSFDSAPLDQVINWLEDFTPMNVVVRWDILEENGVDKDKPISMQVRNLRFSQVLWLLMQEAGGSDVKLAYRASGELLIISTADDLGKEMVVRVYDVSDLLVRAEKFYGAPHMDLQNSQNLGSQGGGTGNIFGGTGSGGSRDDDERGGRGREEEDTGIQELIDLIVTTVEPNSWALNGGLGTIQAFRNLLVVRNNILVHQALGGYVEEAD